jgi:hypothetical protein
MSGERIGLIGYSCNSGGLGEANRQVAKYVPGIVKWLVIRKRGLRIAPIPEGIEKFNKFTPEFLENIDTLLFFETPFYTGIVRQAKKAGKRVVCIPMLEWTPNQYHFRKRSKRDWIHYVDLFLCPTRHCYDTLKAESYPVSGFSWPHDTNRFRFTPSSHCHQFLFIEGNGGFKGRKGASVVKRAKELWPGMPLIVKTFRPRNTWRKGTLIVKPGNDNLSLYSQGDVLIYPGKCDGIGLQPFEARVSGIPVIITKGRPWGENPSMAEINSTHSKRIVSPGRAMDWYEADPKHLVEICQSFLGKEVSSFAKIGRDWAEGNSWSTKGESLTRAILQEEPEAQQIQGQT